MGVETQIRRLCELMKSEQELNSDLRKDERHRRTLPIVILPWTEPRAAAELLLPCLTHDLADQGISLISPSKCEDSTILIGFWTDDGSLEEPWFFRAEVKSIEPTKDGAWRFGTHVHEFMNQQHRELIAPLFPLAKKRINLAATTLLWSESPA
ncbi:MAG: hypothetical protein GY768_02560 [Planctomycetaceae bacterium]|nr:hypothetical protein [Planctomycetaceae bacterium]